MKCKTLLVTDTEGNTQVFSDVEKVTMGEESLSILTSTDFCWIDKAFVSSYKCLNYELTKDN